MLVTRKSLKTNQGEVVSSSSSSIGTEEEKKEDVQLNSARDKRDGKWNELLMMETRCRSSVPDWISTTKA